MNEQDDFLEELERLDRFLEGEEPGERPIDVMRAGGIEIPPEEDLDDRQQHAKLWEIIDEMAALGFVLESTDHLDDRALYRFLVTDALMVEELLPGPRGCCHISPIGGCSEEDIDIYLRYYADEETRRDWRHRPVPAREPLPFDRDRLLPSAEGRFFGPADA